MVTLKKVLILTVSLGMGHNSSAKAIEDELKSDGIDVLTLDVYQYINKILSETLNLSADDVIHPENNKNNSTYKKINRLLQRCDESQLHIILATTEAIINSSDKTPHN